MRVEGVLRVGAIVATALSLTCVSGTAIAKAKPAPLAVGVAGGYATIQAAIDAAVAGDTIDVYPGDYLGEAAPGEYVLGTNGPHQFGLFIGQDKSGLTIRGVDAKGHVIHEADKVAAFVTTDATNNFGYSGIFVEADHVTLSGLEIGENLSGTNKTIEVIGDDFTLLDCVFSDPVGASVYFGDWRFDETHGTSWIRGYRIEGNEFLHSASLDIGNGAGASGPVKDRIIRHNSFENADYWPSISFNGTIAGIGWLLYPVGGAVIKDNDFENTFTGTYPGDPDPLYLETQGHIRARGIYDNSTFDWDSYWRDNHYNHAYVLGVKPPKDVAAYTYDPTPWGYPFPIENVRRIGALLAGEQLHLVPGLKIASK